MTEDKKVEWKTLWHYHLVNFGRPLGDIKDVTQRLHLLTTVGGNKLRLKLDNRYSKGSMSVGAIEVGVGSATRKVTVGGKSDIVLKPGETVLTDPVETDVKAGQWLDVYMHIAEMTGVCAICQTWSAGTWQTEFYPSGDRSVVKESTDLFEHLRMDVHKPTAAFGISHVDIETDESVKTIALFGDSITHMSYYYDPLLRRVVDKFSDKAALANEGIGGNRLCHDPAIFKMINAPATMFGPAGYKRFEENLYTDMTPDTVLLLEGINDCSHGYQFGDEDKVPSAEEFIARMTECVDCAHKHGSRIYLGTVMPASAFDKEEWYSKSEGLRLAINEWIRTQTIADGVVDFDAVMRSPENPSSPIAELMMEDGLHPDTPGGEKMAELVPLELFLNR